MNMWNDRSHRVPYDPVQPAYGQLSASFLDEDPPAPTGGSRYQSRACGGPTVPRLNLGSDVPQDRRQQPCHFADGGCATGLPAQMAMMQMPSSTKAHGKRKAPNPEPDSPKAHAKRLDSSRLDDLLGGSSSGPAPMEDWRDPNLEASLALAHALQEQEDRDARQQTERQQQLEQQRPQDWMREDVRDLELIMNECFDDTNDLPNDNNTSRADDRSDGGGSVDTQVNDLFDGEPIDPDELIADCPKPTPRTERVMELRCPARPGAELVCAEVLQPVPPRPPQSVDDGVSGSFPPLKPVRPGESRAIVVD